MDIIIEWQLFQLVMTKGGMPVRIVLRVHIGVLIVPIVDDCYFPSF